MVQVSLSQCKGSTITAFPHKICSYWEEEFNILIPWKEIFRTIYNTIIDSYSRIFLLKIFYEITATKKQLNMFNIEQSPLCRFCSE